MINVTWRRALGVLTALGALLVVAVLPQTAQAQTDLPGVVDIAVSAEQEIQTVAWDQQARVDWNVSNVGVEPSSSSTLKVQLPAGATFVSYPGISYPCTAAGTTVTCQVGALAPGNTTTDPVTDVLLPGVSSEVVTIFFEVPNAAASLVSTATLTNNSLLASVDLFGNTAEYTPNNTATSTTNVIAPQTGTTSGWIPPCGTMSTGLNAQDGRIGTLQNGVIKADGTCSRTTPLGVERLAFQDATTQTCGSNQPNTCLDGFVKDFVADEDLENDAPAVWTISFGNAATCAGVGTGAGCPGSTDYYFEDEADTTGYLVPKCIGSSGGAGGGGTIDPLGYCSNRVFKVNQKIFIELLISHNGFDLGSVLNNVT